MRYRYFDDFRRGISVFAIFSYGIAVLGTPQCPPSFSPKKLTLLPLLKELKPSRSLKMIKPLTLFNFFPLPRHSR